ncbi:septum formation initiator family protein [Pseudarthrobacter phenanthrenivorans]|uniref:Septum formation initiator family protein n=1 Tax=Pseudarthrobacter phenanthrenivorans TaxID=361575 RepID=A0A3B0FZ49_PSEPS|nr:septum formation initiator family protein [Pseudarthrobacter phenanthrenivorans]RKO24958.1 septum formation initiator family protein [Pseudarthrobacter phenanthrenivorans]TPV51572.1 septum formation initiator family protein [Pseudarthrobacter phenanthrenivorans]
MATRRPKVPKVAPSRSPKEASEGADVIRADFGSAKDAPAPESTGPAAHRPGKPAGKGPGHAGRNGSSAAAGPGKPAAETTSDEDQQPVPAKAFSGRMLALAVVMIAITIMLAPTVKIFFDKKAEIDALNADISARQAEGDVLRQQVSRWQDPNYVKQQARDRINMVMPGETGYWVFGSDLPAGETSSQPGAAAQDPADLPWVDSLWESITRAATD